MLQMTSLWKSYNKPRRRADFLMAMKMVSSPRFTLLLKDYVKILKELNGHSRASGKSKLSLQHTPTPPASTSLYTIKQNKGTKLIGRQTEHAFKKRAAHTH